MGVLVYFFELSGSQAQTTLQTFEQKLRDYKVVSSELLQSLEQPDLFLLVVRTDAGLSIVPPQGTRVWKFETLSRP
jgi:hypothetical protein